MQPPRLTLEFQYGTISEDAVDGWLPFCNICGRMDFDKTLIDQPLNNALD
jgi:hypothetical protein